MEFFVVPSWDLDGKITSGAYEDTEQKAQAKVASLKLLINSSGELIYPNAFYVPTPPVDVKYLIVEGVPPNNTIRIDQERLNADTLGITIAGIEEELERRLSEYKSSQGRLNDLNIYVDLLGKRANNGGAFTSEQQPIADGLAVSMDWITRTMDAAKSLKANPPSNFKDSEHWPNTIS